MAFAGIDSVTTVPGGTSGNLYWHQPVKGTGAKKVVITLAAYKDNTGCAITFPVAFTFGVAITSNNTGLTIATLSTSAITIPAADNSGTIVVEGI